MAKSRDWRVAGSTVINNNIVYFVGKVTGVSEKQAEINAITELKKLFNCNEYLEIDFAACHTMNSKLNMLRSVLHYGLKCYADINSEEPYIFDGKGEWTIKHKKSLKDMTQEEKDMDEFKRIAREINRKQLGLR